MCHLGCLDSSRTSLHNEGRELFQDKTIKILVNYFTTLMATNIMILKAPRFCGVNYNYYFERAPLKFILLIITWAPEQEISGLFMK